MFVLLLLLLVFAILRCGLGSCWRGWLFSAVGHFLFAQQLFLLLRQIVYVGEEEPAGRYEHENDEGDEEIDVHKEAARRVVLEEPEQASFIFRATLVTPELIRRYD